MPLEGPGKRPPPSFSQLRERHGPGLFGRGEGEYLHTQDIGRGGAESVGPRQVVLYARTPLNPNASWEKALATSLARQEAAKLIKAAIATEYGPDVAEGVLRNVRSKVLATENRLLDVGMTRGDLELLQQELKQPSEELQMLQVLQVLQELQERVRRMPDETPEDIKDDLAETWRSTGDATRTIRWSNGDVEVQLRETICTDYLDDRNSVEFNEAAGTLTLTMGDAAVSREKKMMALTSFIGRHFEAEPGQPAFRNVANNILSYLHQGLAGSMTKKMTEVADGEAFGEGNAILSTYRLSVSKDEDGNLRGVGVACDVGMPFIYPTFKDNDDASTRAVDLSKYTFVRRQGFEISGEHLRSDRFDPEANLGFVSRVDTINLGQGRDSPALK